MRRPIAILALAALALTAAEAGAQTTSQGTPVAGRGGRVTNLAQARAQLGRELQLPAGIELVGQQHQVGELRVFRLTQTHRGVPVIARGAALVTDSQGQTRFTTHQLERQLPSDTTPRLGRLAATRKASAAAGQNYQPSDLRLAILPSTGGGRLVWVSYSSRWARLGRSPVLVLDALSGEVLLDYDALRFDRLASVYQFNPTSTPTPTEVTLDFLAPGATLLDSEFANVFNCIDRQTTTSVQGLTIHACELEQHAVADANGDFFYPPLPGSAPEDPHAEVAMAYHVAKVYSWAQGLGMPTLPQGAINATVNLRLPAGFDEFDTTLMANPNLPLVAFDNAFYAPQDPFFSSLFGTTGAGMWFGQGGSADYAYDGDVVYHEFGHAIIDHTVQLVSYWHLDEQGASGAPGAMNEGLADYFSSALAGDPVVGEYAGASAQRIAIRDISGADACPSHLVGEVHADATFWSAALWAARTTLAEVQQPDFDTAVMSALMAAPGGDLGFAELAELMVTSVAASPLGTSVATQLESEFEARGVLPDCTRTFVWDGSTVSNHQGFFVIPGKSVMPIPASAAYAPGGFQVQVDISEPADQLALTWEHSDDQGGFGSGGSVDYQPAVLVRFADDPLAFDYSSGVDSNGELFAVEKSGRRYSGSIAIPEGATRAWLMVVNEGDDDALLSSLDIDLEVSPAGAGGSGPGGSGPVFGSGGSGWGAGGAGGAAPEGDPGASDDEGCGCRVVGGSAPDGGLVWLGLSVLGLAGWRRRGSRRGAQWSAVE